MGRRKSSGKVADPKAVALLEACEKGDMRAVKKLAADKSFGIDTDVNGVTGLMKACAYGHKAIVLHLTAAGAVNGWTGPSEDPHNAFCWAAEYGQLEIVRWFVEESGGDFEVMCTNQGRHKRKTALDYVLQSIDPEEQPHASAEKYKVLAYLQEKGGRFGEGVMDKDAIFAAAAKGNAYYLLYCISARPSIVALTAGKERHTLLHVAATGNHADLAKVLLANGIKRDARSADGLTALHTAAALGSDKVVAVLLEADSDEQAADTLGQTPLHAAAQGGHLSTCRVLLSRAASKVEDEMASTAMATVLKMPDASGDTAVTLAFKGGPHIPVIRYFEEVLDGTPAEAQGSALAAAAAAAAARNVPALRHASMPSLGNVAMFDTADDDEGDAPEADGPPGVLQPGASQMPLERLISESETAPNAPHIRTLSEGEESVTDEVDLWSEQPPRVARFLRALKPTVWGYDLARVFVITRGALLSHGKLPSFAQAHAKGALVPLTAVLGEANILYVSHKWASADDPDPGAETFVQVKKFLETKCRPTPPPEPPVPETGSRAGPMEPEELLPIIDYVWVDCACVPAPADADALDAKVKQAAALDAHASRAASDYLPRIADAEAARANTITALLRATHFLAIPGKSPVPTEAPPATAAAAAAADATETAAVAAAETADSAPTMNGATSSGGGDATSTSGGDAAAEGGGGGAPEGEGGGAAAGDAGAVTAAGVTASGEAATAALSEGWISDFEGYLGSGWGQIETTMAAFCGLELYVGVRWETKVAFRSVLVSPPDETVITSDLETDEEPAPAPPAAAPNHKKDPPPPPEEPQELGFRGAAIAAAKDIVPDMAQLRKGLWQRIVEVFVSSKPVPVDLAAPIKDTFNAAFDAMLPADAHLSASTEATRAVIAAVTALRVDKALAGLLSAQADAFGVVSLAQLLSTATVGNLKACIVTVGPMANELERPIAVVAYLTAIAFLMGYLEPQGPAAAIPPHIQSRAQAMHIASLGGRLQHTIDAHTRQIADLEAAHAASMTAAVAAATAAGEARAREALGRPQAAPATAPPPPVKTGCNCTIS